LEEFVKLLQFRTEAKGSRMAAHHGYELESFASIRKRLGWRLQMGIWIFVIGGGFITLYLRPSYYWPILAASGATGAILLRFWAFSRRGWFWMTMTAFTLLQVPFIILSRDIAIRWKWVFGFFFMLLDFLVMDAVVRWVSPELRRNS
jgi:hypothetical protein